MEAPDYERDREGLANGSEREAKLAAASHQMASDGVDWKQAHQQLVTLSRSRAGLDWEEGRWLVVALRGGADVRLGYGSFAEYIERLFGYCPRLTHEKLRVAEALEGLPALAQALCEGRTSWSALRELTRVATPQTEGDWLEAAQGKTVREVERLVSGHGPGSQPTDPSESGVRRHVLRLEVSGEAFAMFREAMAKVRRDAGEPLDDDSAVLLMARRVLEGPTDEGRSSYQVAMTVCESCRRGLQQGCGELVEVGMDVVEMAACDAQHIGITHLANPHGTSDAAPHVGNVAGAQARIHGMDPTDLRPALPVAAHVGGGQAPPRATQEIPPATRRAVLRRDAGRCVVPGCRHATFVDVHHVKLRSERGDHHPDNLVTLCAAHHRAVHRGHISIEGSVASGLRIAHADGTPYGAQVSAGLAEAHGRAFRALRGMGFGEGEVRRAVRQVETHVGTSTDVEVIIRSCLEALTSRVLAQAS